MTELIPKKSLSNTRASLLVRLRDISDGAAWCEFHELYAPLLYHYARARGLHHVDAEEVRSECFAALVRQMLEFEYDRAKGTFKSWLRTMVCRRVADRLRRQRELNVEGNVLDQLQDDHSGEDEAWEAEWRRQHLNYCIDQAKLEVSEQTWQAFQLLAEKDATVVEVGNQLGMNSNQVYKAKARMLSVIKRRMQYLLLDAE